MFMYDYEQEFNAIQILFLEGIYDYGDFLNAVEELDREYFGYNYKNGYVYCK